MGHAVYSPSGACKWMNCRGSTAMERGMPNPTSKYSDEGTAAHFLASEMLTYPKIDYLGKLIVVTNDDETLFWEKGGQEPKGIRTKWIVGHEMFDYITGYIERVHDLCTDDSELYVEVKLPLVKITGEKDAEGTSDNVILNDINLIVGDLKYGKGITVSAVENEQLMIYALAALDNFQTDYHTKIEIVTIIIDQPRKDNYSKWDISVNELEDFREKVMYAAQMAQTVVASTRDVDPDSMQNEKSVVDCLTPGDHCRKGFCNARHKCPALGDKVLGAIQVASFEDLTKSDDIPPLGTDTELLSYKLRCVGLIESWCKAVRGAVQGKLFAGEKVPGFKVVQGKKGNRGFIDNELVADLLKKGKTKHEFIYDYKMRTPTVMEKLAQAGHITKTTWTKVSEHITQTEGGMSVAPESDPREAMDISPPVFEDLTEDNPLKDLI